MLCGYCPLVKSIVELRQQVEGDFTFSKQDIFHNLGVLSLRLEAKTQRLHNKAPLPCPPPLLIGGVEPCPAKTQGADVAILASPGCTPNDESPPAEPTTLPAEINLPGSAEISLRGSTKMP